MIFIFYFLALIYVAYRLATWTYNLKDKYGFNGPKPLPLIGNLLDFVKYGFHVCDVENQKKYGHIYPIYMGQVGMLVVSDEDILRQMLVKDAKSFMDRPGIRGSAQIMKKTLVRLKGKDWERVRALTTPIFTSGKLKKMSPMIVGSVNEMVRRFQKAENTNIDVKELFGCLTMDAIAKTMFGIEINVSENNSHAFINYAKGLFNFSSLNFYFVIMNLFPQTTGLIEYFNPNGIISPESIVYFRKTLTETIENRKKSKEEYHDFLTLMLNAHKELNENQKNEENQADIVNYKGLTEEEIMAQSIVFLMAGYETTASALTFSSYYLAKNPDTQDEIYNELKENLPDEKEITYDMLANLSLLEQCLQETLRICPPASRFTRTCTKDAILTSSTGQTIHAKKGSEFVIPVYAIHHDARIWPNPEKYDIHRFDQNEKQNRSQFSYMPFGMGPRTCVGMRFALLEAKFALAYLLKNYKILPCAQTPKALAFSPSGVTKVKEPVIIRLEKR